MPNICFKTAQKPIVITFIDAINADINVGFSERNGRHLPFKILADKDKYQLDEKYVVTPAAFDLAAQTADKWLDRAHVTTAGSAFNFAVQLADLASSAVKIKFITSLNPDTEFGRAALEILSDRNIEVINLVPPGGYNLQNGMSKNLVARNLDNGRRFILKFEGTDARNAITPDNIPIDVLQTSDVVSLQGSMISRLSLDVFYKALANITGQLWLTYPTDSKTAQQNQDLFKSLAAYVLSKLTVNEIEYKRIHGEGDLYELLKQHGKNWQEIHATDNSRSALVTSDLDGVRILNQQTGISHHPARMVHAVDTTGAGDAAAVGFAVGQILGVSPGALAVSTSRANVLHLGSCMLDAVAAMSCDDDAVVQQMLAKRPPLSTERMQKHYALA